VRPASTVNLAYEWIPFDKNFKGRIATIQEKLEEFELIKNTGGREVKVAVIDHSLVKNHFVLKKLHLENFVNCNEYKYPNNNNVFSLSNFHGADCVSILTARPFSRFPFIGVAPFVDFYFLSFGGKHKESNALLKSFEKAIELDVDIISLSYAIKSEKLPKSFFEQVFNLIKKAEEKNIIIFISGDKDKEVEKNQLLASPHVIGIDVHESQTDVKNPTHQGVHFSFNSKNLLIPVLRMNTQRTDFIVQSVKFVSSYATSMMAGFFANLLSFEREKRGKKSFRFTLNQSIKKLDSFSIPLSCELEYFKSHFYYTTVKNLDQ
jgi:hypothetical protein